MAKETALALTGQKPLAISMRQEQPSASWLVKSLTALATARQASVSKDTFLLYASELADYREDDLSLAIRKIAMRPREEGETAFPDLGTLTKAVRSVRGERLTEEDRVRRKNEWDALEEDRRLHPEKYFSMKDVLRTFNEQRKAAADASEVVA